MGVLFFADLLEVSCGYANTVLQVAFLAVTFKVNLQAASLTSSIAAASNSTCETVLA